MKYSLNYLGPEHNNRPRCMPKVWVYLQVIVFLVSSHYAYKYYFELLSSYFMFRMLQVNDIGCVYAQESSDIHQQIEFTHQRMTGYEMEDTMFVTHEIQNSANCFPGDDGMHPRGF